MFEVDHCTQVIMEIKGQLVTEHTLRKDASCFHRKRGSNNLPYSVFLFQKSLFIYWGEKMIQKLATEKRTEQTKLFTSHYLLTTCLLDSLLSSFLQPQTELLRFPTLLLPPISSHMLGPECLILHYLSLFSQTSKIPLAYLLSAPNLTLFQPHFHARHASKQ